MQNGLKKSMFDLFNIFLKQKIDYTVQLFLLRHRWGPFTFNTHVQVVFMFHVIHVLCLIYLGLPLRLYVYNMVYLKAAQQNPSSKVCRFECNRCL